MLGSVGMTCLTHCIRCFYQVMFLNEELNMFKISGEFFKTARETHLSLNVKMKRLNMYSCVTISLTKNVRTRSSGSWVLPDSVLEIDWLNFNFSYILVASVLLPKEAEHLLTLWGCMKRFIFIDLIQFCTILTILQILTVSGGDRSCGWVRKWIYKIIWGSVDRLNPILHGNYFEIYKVT